MSIIGFVITRREPSQVIAMLLIINGGIIIAGMIILIAEGSGTTRNATITISSTIGIGIVLVGLGIAKVKLDRALIERKHRPKIIFAFFFHSVLLKKVAVLHTLLYKTV